MESISFLIFKNLNISEMYSIAVFYAIKTHEGHQTETL